MGLTNRIRPISHHITPLFINALGGGHTYTHTNAQTKTISRNQACAAKKLCAPGLKIIGYNKELPFSTVSDRKTHYTKRLYIHYHCIVYTKIMHKNLLISYSLSECV